MGLIMHACESLKSCPRWSFPPPRVARHHHFPRAHASIPLPPELITHLSIWDILCTYSRLLADSLVRSGCKTVVDVERAAPAHVAKGKPTFEVMVVNKPDFVLSFAAIYAQLLCAAPKSLGVPNLRRSIIAAHTMPEGPDGLSS
jgi:hypothetical protein